MRESPHRRFPTRHRAFFGSAVGGFPAVSSCSPNAAQKNAARQRERCENDDDRGSNCTNAPGLDRRGARRLSRTLRAARARPRTPLVKPLSHPERERRRHARPRGSPPELAINLAENWQVRWWCEHFGVTHRELFEAIAAVGVSAEAVRRHLRR
jgi:hypothetical protein